MHAILNTGRKVLFYAVALMLISSAADAGLADRDPFINAFPSIALSVSPVTDCGLPPFLSKCLIPGLSTSTQILIPSFASVSTTGGGIAQLFAPVFTSSSTGARFDLNLPPAGHFTEVNSITTIGPGSATAHFGETVLVNITNVSSTGITVNVSENPIWGTNAFANPLVGESMSLDTQVGVLRVDGTSNSLGYLTEHKDCNLNTMNNMLFPCSDAPDFGSGFDIAFVAPGQTLSYEMVINEDWSVTKVPEPSSLLLLASVLALGLYPLRKARKLPAN
jgi:hypothetical protein